MSIDIIFETHSISVDNARGIASGWQDCSLSEEGKRLAAERVERRRAENIDAVFTSDLARAVETADIAFGNSGIPVYRDGRLRECNYGALNGAPIEKVEAERPKHINMPFPEGESYSGVVERVRDFLNDLSRNWDGKRVIIIGHSATCLALDVLLDGKELSDVVNTPFVWQEEWRYILT